MCMEVQNLSLKSFVNIVINKSADFQIVGTVYKI